MAKINRPWTTTFEGAVLHAKARPAGLEQLHKLSRNYACSLDVGVGHSALFVDQVDHQVFTNAMSGKERYLEWVRNWKRFYAMLSEVIRHYKKADRAELNRLKETAQVMLNARAIGKMASWAVVQRIKRLNAI